MTQEAKPAFPHGSRTGGATPPTGAEQYFHDAAFGARTKDLALTAFGIYAGLTMARDLDRAAILIAAAEHLKADRPHRLRVGNILMTNVELADALLEFAAQPPDESDTAGHRENEPR